MTFSLFVINARSQLHGRQANRCSSAVDQGGAPRRSKNEVLDLASDAMLFLYVSFRWILFFKFSNAPSPWTGGGRFKFQDHAFAIRGNRLRIVVETRCLSSHCGIEFHPLEVTRCVKDYFLYAWSACPLPTVRTGCEKPVIWSRGTRSLKNLSTLDV